MRRFRSFLALLLAAVLLLTGCHGGSTALDGLNLIHYSEMEYTRPELTGLETTLDSALELAQGDPTKETVNAVLDAVYAFYDEYDRFYTNYSLADLKTCHDMTDIYWDQEYTWCLEASGTVDAMLEELYYALAKSPCRNALENAYFGEGFFDAYEGESMYDETFLSMLEEEAALTSRYYDLSSAALDYEYGSQPYYDACSGDMIELLVDLIALRQEMAAYWGYSDYVAFANDFYYYRDYSPRQTEQYLADIAEHLVPLYRQLDLTEIWDLSDRYADEKETFAFVQKAAENMGGLIHEAFTLMEKAEMYDIEYGENKYSTSFEIYLTTYYQPFIFMNPELSRYDSLTFAHEFGHFCNDYACFGSYAGVDVSEFYSQGMEYLSLCYGENMEDLVKIKMADSLCLFVEQAAFASFEQRMYRLTGEDLTAEGLRSLYAQVAREFGFETVGFDNREFVTITHFYTNPMYIQSYIFSNDAAMQLYALEQQEPGAGLKLHKKNLSSQEPWFLAFLETAGLGSPFETGRVEALADTFRETLT